MKALWRHIPPFSPDTSGFAAVINGTDGIGIIDDSRGCAGNYYSSEEYRYHLKNRVFVSEIANEDVILGTEKKIISKFRQESKNISPNFALLCGSPVASFIGTDLKEVANTLAIEFGIPASAVDLTGHESYEKGISKTLDCLMRMLVKSPAREASEELSNGINVIGATFLDWGEQNIENLNRWTTQQGMEVLSILGSQESSNHIRRASGASCSLVLTVSGLLAARSLHTLFGIPVIAGAPFGKSWSSLLLSGLKNKCMPEMPIFDSQNTKAIVIGEQIMANALRATLRLDYGITAVKVCSFFMMDRKLKESEDVLLRSEKELRDFLWHHPNTIVIGDPFYRYFSPKTCRWIDLPHRAVSGKIFADQMPLLLGEGTNQWLDTVL